jgi:hypothetical protein
MDEAAFARVKSYLRRAHSKEEHPLISKLRDAAARFGRRTRDVGHR